MAESREKPGSTLRIAVACAGTGGHVFPGLATAMELQERGHDVTLWLSGRNIEKAAAGNWTGKTVLTKSYGMPMRHGIKSLAASAMLARAVTSSFLTMIAGKPSAVLAMGGYGSVGPVIAARMLGIPVILHEANAVPGRAIKFLSRFASAVAVGFPDTTRLLKCREIVHTGFPVMPDNMETFPGSLLDEDKPVILVAGGSQGAHKLNTIVPEGVKILASQGLEMQVIHITGANDERQVRHFYTSAGIKHAVFSFINGMHKAYRAADIAVVRAGAATCAELAIHAKPAIFIPITVSSGNHQFENARIMRDSGGCRLLEEKDLTPATLATMLMHGLTDRNWADTARAKLAAMAVPDAAPRLADLIEDKVRNSL